jgi:hypothetical protein
MVKYGVLFEVRTEFLNNIYTSFGFRGLMHSTHCGSDCCISIPTPAQGCVGVLNKNFTGTEHTFSVIKPQSGKQQPTAAHCPVAGPQRGVFLPPG